MSVIKTTVGVAVLLLAGCFTSRAQVQQYSWQHLPQVSKPVFKKDTINILKYGAKADGITLNTTSINKAIAACSAKRAAV
jgi:polygalacturonase